MQRNSDHDVSSPNPSLCFNHLMFSCCNNNRIKNFAKKYVHAIEQNPPSRRVSGLSGGWSMVHRLDFDLGLHRLAAAEDGGGSGD